MLILTLRPNESVFIGNAISVRYMRRALNEDAAYISVTAPPGTTIERAAAQHAPRTLLHIATPDQLPFIALLNLHQWLFIDSSMRIKLGSFKSLHKASFVFGAPDAVRILRESIADMPPTTKARRASA